jgi:hypothetical protein
MLLFGKVKEMTAFSTKGVLQIQAYQHPNPNKVILESVPLTDILLPCPLL